MLAMALVLIAIIGAINVVNYANMVGQADGILSILAENDGHFPEAGPGSDPANADDNSQVTPDADPAAQNNAGNSPHFPATQKFTATRILARLNSPMNQDISRS